MKKNLFLSLAFCLTFAFSDFAFGEEVTVAVPDSPYGFACLYLQEYESALFTETKDLEIDYDYYTHSNYLRENMVSKKYDFAVLSADEAKEFLEEEGGYSLGAICALGTYYVVSKDPSLLSINNLEDKTLYIPSDEKGIYFIVENILRKNNISYKTTVPENEELVVLGEQSEEVKFVILDNSLTQKNISSQLLTSHVEYAVLQEDAFLELSAKNKRFKKSLNIQKEFSKNSFPMYVLLVKKDFAEENKQFVKSFYKNYKAATEWADTNPIKVSLVAREYGEFSYSADFIKKVIPGSNYVFINGRKADKMLSEYYKITVP